MNYTNGTEVKSKRELQNSLNMSFPIGSPPDGWTEYITPDPEFVPYYSVYAEQVTIRIGSVDPVLVAVSGDKNVDVVLYAFPVDVVPDETYELAPVTLDENGRGSVPFYAPNDPLSIGEYVIRGRDGALADEITIIKVVG